MNQLDILRRAAAGDCEAWRHLFDACYPRVVASIRRDRTFGKLVDATDVANEAFRRVIVDVTRMRFATLGDLTTHLVADARALLEPDRSSP